MTLLVLAFVILLNIGMPVAFVVGLAGVAFFASTADLPFSIVVQRIVAQTQSYSFLAVPFFIFAGTLMNESGITQRILQFASALTRRMWGGVAQVSVIMSTMMGGISGSATADAAMETRLLGPPSRHYCRHHPALARVDYLRFCRRGVDRAPVCRRHHPRRPHDDLSDGDRYHHLQAQPV